MPCGVERACGGVGALENVDAGYPRGVDVQMVVDNRSPRGVGEAVGHATHARYAPDAVDHRAGVAVGEMLAVEAGVLSTQKFEQY